MPLHQPAGLLKEPREFNLTLDPGIKCSILVGRVLAFTQLIDEETSSVGSVVFDPNAVASPICIGDAARSTDTNLHGA